jgi:hypothetical protein
VARRRLLLYRPLSESRPFYRPRHAAPSLLLRLALQLSLALSLARQVLGYYPPPRHRRRPALVQPQWPRLGTASLATSRGQRPYYPVFSAGPGRVAIRHG